MNQSTNNRRIMKNAMYMYIRMFVMMILSLYTSRIILQTLGFENYGIYNIVGGIVVFFSFLNNGLSTATKRYITANIADNDIDKGRHTFNVCIQAHLLISIIIFVLAELLGPLFIKYYLNIPEGREIAAQAVYQVSVITAILSIIQSPFGAAIVAYERLNIYAYYSIIDVVLKLLIVYLIQVLPGDTLITYSLLLLAVCIFNFVFYRIYCYRNFPICKYKKIKDKDMLKEIFKFMSWNTLGQVTVVGSNQGVSILINMFYNVTANAAMGISNTITNIVGQFTSNFMVAFNPQIIKSYNLKEYDYLRTLVLRSTKITSYLYILLIIPIVFEIDKVLSLWLGDYPPYSVEFCIFTLCCMYIDSISAPIYMVIYSQTNIKNYQIAISSVYSLCFFAGWIVLLLGGAPYSVMIVRLLVLICLLSLRLYFLKKVFLQFNIKEWLMEIILKSSIIVAISISCTLLFFNILKCQILLHVCIISMFTLCINVFLMYKFGLNQSERQFINRIIEKKIKLFRK